MANYYDWNPSEDKPKQPEPAVEPTDQTEQSPVTPPESVIPAGSADALTSQTDTNHWALEDYVAAPPTSLDGLESLSEPIDVEDELHPMYRVVTAMMDEETATASDEQIDIQAAESLVSEPVVVEGLDEGVPPTETLNDALLADPDFPSIPTRIEELTQAIERYPQSPVNYILRGEAHWDEGHGPEAVRDFLAALNLAEHRDTTWEFLNRSYLDRARQGLRRTGYKNNV